MKTVILAGGKGTRIGEESQFRPKPMVEIGGKPIMWHIMQHYSKYNYNEFVICCGYKGNMIKEYFMNYSKQYSNLSIDMETGEVCALDDNIEPWKVTMVNTGLNTLTAGRILQIRPYVKNERFMLTYGDGVSDINIDDLMEFHKKHGKLITISVTKPLGRFGVAQIDPISHEITGFKEKRRDDQNFVNIGFMVCEPGVFDYLGDGSTMLETEPFERIVAQHQMVAYEHQGFWSPMDSLHDRKYLEDLIRDNKAPWLS